MADGDRIEKRRDRTTGHRRSSRSSASSWLGMRKARIPCRSAQRSAQARDGAAIQMPGWPSAGAAPNATPPARRKATTTAARRPASRVPQPCPARVRRRGQIRRRSASVVGSVGRTCALSGGLPDTCIRAAWDHTHSGNSIAVYHLVKCRTRPNDGELIRFHQNLGDQRAGVVLARHHRTIGPGGAEGDQIARRPQVA
jgi:hypothetical protein